MAVVSTVSRRPGHSPFTCFQGSADAIDGSAGVAIIPAVAGVTAVLDALGIGTVLADTFTISDGAGALTAAMAKTAGLYCLPESLTLKASAQNSAISVTTGGAVAVGLIYHYHYE
jgi:hypothetical protein